jgi:starch phosphorylase
VLGARPVAYFSAEFGLHESMPIYSGGLGILAGDHSRARRTSASRWSASVSTTTRAISVSGSIATAGTRGLHRRRSPAAADAAGNASTGSGDRGDRDAHRHASGARVWQPRSAATTLLLLDSNVEGNSPEDRELTARLYGGDDRIRIRQELLLGIGGVRALARLGVSPESFTSTKDTARLPALELIRRRMASEGISVEEAYARVASQVVFTTIRRCPPATIVSRRNSSKSISDRCATALGMSYDAFLALGRVNPYDPRRGLLHDGAGAEVLSSARTPCRRCTGKSRARCGRRSTRACARSTCPSATSPTACT